MTFGRVKCYRVAPLLLFLSCTLLVLLAVDVVTRGPVATTDAQVDVWMTAHRNTGLTHLATVLSATAQAIVGVLVVLVVGTIAAARVHTWRPLIAAALTAAGLAGSVYVAKYIVSSLFCALHPGLNDDVGFPSGHAATATVMGGGALVLLGAGISKGWRVTAVIALSVYAGAVGVSRLYLGVHRLSDVAGGWLIGSALTLALGQASIHQRVTSSSNRE